MEASRPKLQLPPRPALASSSVPAISISPYDQQIIWQRGSKLPDAAGGGFDPSRPAFLVIDGIDPSRNAPIPRHTLGHVEIQKMNAACTAGDFDLLQTLIVKWKTGQNPPLETPGYEIYALEPVFYNAIRNNQPRIVSYFFDNGIRMCSLAIQEAYHAKASPDMFQVFVDHGWDISDRGGRKENHVPLFYSPLCHAIQADSGGKLVKFFLEAGANPNGLAGGYRRGVTNFMWAARFSSFHIVKMMYSYGGRPVSSILAYAILRPKECVEVIEFLLDIGASIDALEYEHDPPNLSSFTNRGSAINIACCKKDSEDVVELLLSRGARIDIRTFLGRTCLDLAKDMSSQRVVNLIERRIKAEEAITKEETYK